MFGIKKLKEKLYILEAQVGNLAYDHAENAREALSLKSKIETKVSECDMERIVGEKAVAIINWTQQNPAKYNVGDSVLYDEETCWVVTVELAGYKLELDLGVLAWFHLEGNNDSPKLHWKYLIDNKKGKTYTVEAEDLKPLAHEK